MATDPNGSDDDPNGVVRDKATSNRGSGSIDVDFSRPVNAPEKSPRDESGSIPVLFSNPAIKLPTENPTEPTVSPTEGSDHSGPLARAGDRLSDGVGMLGDGVGVIGDGISKLGDRVKRLPAGKMIGGGIHDLGEGVTELGASLTSIPVMRKTRRGRVMLRGMLVGLALVAIWVVVIVYAQLRGARQPNLRPVAEALLLQLQDREFVTMYDESSQRFKEVMIEDQFVDLMEDLTRTLGDFVEISAVNNTLVTQGPGGRIARVDMLLQFAKGKAQSNLSLQWDERRWKLLGISVTLPEELIAIETSQEARRARVTDKVEVDAIVRAAKAIIVELAAGRPDVVWNDAAPVFQQTVQQADFARLEADRQQAVGRANQYLDTTVAQTNPSKTSAIVVALVEYEHAVVTTRFGFVRRAGDDHWRLTSYKVVLPMPLSDQSTEPSPSQTPGTTESVRPDAVPLQLAPPDAAPK